MVLRCSDIVPVTIMRYFGNLQAISEAHVTSALYNIIILHGLCVVKDSLGIYPKNRDGAIFSVRLVMLILIGFYWHIFTGSIDL